MNGHCSTCDVEHLCFYQYKPCDCCNYRKFTEQQSLPTGEKPGNVIPIRQQKGLPNDQFNPTD